MTKVFEGLNVYPDNMLREIKESRGCYASSEVKEFLKEGLAPLGISSKDAYRIVQLGAFNVFSPGLEARAIRENPPASLAEADNLLKRFSDSFENHCTLGAVIQLGKLEVSSNLEATEEDVVLWNQALEQLFSSGEVRKMWRKIFLPSHLLQNEAKLYKEILGV